MAMIEPYRQPPPLPTGAALAPPRPPGEVPKGTNLMGTMLVLAADAALLAALLATWFTIKAGSPAWPPRSVNLSTYLPTMVTITAVMSAFSMQWLVSSIRRNDQRTAAVALLLTVVLGLAMINAQWYSLVRARFGVNDHAYGTLYYLLIGYHAVHLVLAIAAVILVGSRALAGHYGRENYDALKATAALWEYTTVAWFFIVTAVFLFSPHT